MVGEKKWEKFHNLVKTSQLLMGRIDGGSQKVREGLKSCQNVQTSNNMWSNLLHIKSSATKGQKMSECIYEILNFPEYHQKKLIDFCLEGFTD